MRASLRAVKFLSNGTNRKIPCNKKHTTDLKRENMMHAGRASKLSTFGKKWKMGWDA